MTDCNERQIAMLRVLALRAVAPISLSDMVDPDYLDLVTAGLVEGYDGVGGTGMAQLTVDGEAYVAELPLEQVLEDMP